MRETWLRIALRSLTWRTGGVILTIALTFVFTGDIILGIEIGVTYNLIRYFSHLAHDSVWARTAWGYKGPVEQPGFLETGGIKKLYPRIPVSKKFKAFVANTRPFTLLLPLLGGYFVIQASLGRFMFPTPDPLATILAIFSMMLLNATGNYWNSIVDVEIDRINKPYRPLPSGLITVVEAVLVSLILAVASISLAASISPTFLGLVTVGMIITAMYSIPPVRLKQRLWWNNISQGIVRGILGPLAMWSIYAEFSSGIYALTAAMFVLIVTGQSVKDIPDLVGDKTFKIRTVPAVYGVPATYRIIGVGVLLTFATLYVLGAMGYLLNAVIVMGMFGLPAVGLFYSLARPGATLTENTLAWNMYYFCMIGLLLGFMFAQLVL